MTLGYTAEASGNVREDMTLETDERWLPDEGICLFLNFSNETVSNWVEQHSMSAHRVGGRWRLNQDDLDEWLVRSGGSV